MNSGHSGKTLFQKAMKPSIGIGALALISVVSLFSFSTTQAVDPVPWTATASVGCPGQGSYSHMAELDGTIYFHPSSGQTFWAFDTSTETCTQLADMPNSSGERDLVAADSDTILLYQYDADQPEGWFDVYKISEDRWYAKTEALFDDDTPVAPASGVQGDGAKILADPSSGYLYVLNGGTTTDFQRFDPGTNTWTTLAATPATIDDGAAMTIIGTTIYVLGGNNTTNFWSYDITGDSWNTGLSATPEAVNSGGSLTTDGTDLYAFRGNRRDFWKYTVGTDTWSNLADAPGYPRAGASLVRIGNDIFTFQGNGTRVLWRYDIVGDAWDETLTPAPAPVTAGGSLTTDGTDLYATQGRAEPTFWFYDVSGDSWTTLPRLPEVVGSTSRASDKGGLAYINNTVWAITGNGTGAKDHATTEFIFRYPLTGINANTWPVFERPESFPENGFRGQAVVKPGTSVIDTAADYLYILGGGNLRDFWRYSISNQAFAPYPRTLINATDTINYKFTQFYPLLDSGNGNTMTKIGSDFYVAIGDGADFDGYFFKYTPGTNEWTRLADTPGEFWDHSCSMAAYNTTEIYAICTFGGESWKYDIATDSWIGPFPLATYDDGTPFDNFAMEGTPAGTSQNAGSSIAAIGTKIYVSRGAFQTFMEFDYETNSWSYTNGTPAGFGNGATIEAANGQIYAFRGTLTGSFYVFDPLENTWTELANYGENVEEGADLHYPGSGDYIYGLRGDNTTTFKRYCFQNTGSGCTVDTWETLASTPAGVRAGGAITSIGGTTIYAFRGNETDDFWTYDIATDQWNTVLADPTDTPEIVASGGDLVTYDNETPGNSADDIIYAIRGANSSEFWSYDPNTDIWTYEAYAPVAMSATSGTITEYGGMTYAPEIGDIFATPGYASNGIENNETVAWLYRYKLSAGSGQYTWPHTKFGTSVSQPPNSNDLFYGQSLAYPGTGDKIYAASGNSENHFFFFDVDLVEWISHTRALSHVAGDFISQAGPSLASPEMIRSTNDGYFYVIKGLSSNLANFYRYDHANNEWYRLAPFPHQQSSGPFPSPHMLENPNNNDEIFVVWEDGSGIAGGNFWTYTISTNQWRTDREPSPTHAINTFTYPGSGDWVYSILGQSNSYTYDFARYSLSKDIWISFKWARFDGDVSAGANPELVSQDEDGAYGNGHYNRGVGLSIISANDKLYIQNGSGSQVGERNYFLEYDPGTNTWTDLAQSPNDYGRGATLGWDGGDYLYGFTGGNSSFYRYCLPDATGCTQDTWSALTSAPAATGDGASIAIPPGSEYAYVTRGSGSTSFWAYCLPGSSGCTGDTWTTLGSFPSAISSGGSIAYGGTTGGSCTNGCLYITRGAGTDDIYRYAIGTAPAGTLTGLAAAPDDLASGARFTWDGSDYLYTVQGENNNTDFYRYSISGNSWTVMDNAPEPMFCSGGACGGGVAYNPGSGDIWLVTATGSSGQIGDTFLPKMVGLLHRYNIADDEWVHYDQPASTGLPNNANYRPSALATFGDEDYLYYVNGNTAPNEFRRYEIQDQAGSPDRTELDPGPGAWEVLPDTPRPKNGPMLSAVDNGSIRSLFSVIGSGTNIFYEFDETAQHAATLYGGQMQQTQVDVSNWTGITDGEFRITIDGNTHDVTGIDYSSATTMDDVASITQAAIRAQIAADLTIPEPDVEFKFCNFEYLTLGDAAYFMLRSSTDPSFGGSVSYMSTVPGGFGTYVGGNSYFEGASNNDSLIKGPSISGDWLDCDEAGAPDFMPSPMGNTASGSTAGHSFYDPILDEIWVVDDDGDNGAGFFLNPHKGLLWRFDVATKTWPHVDPPSDHPGASSAGAAIAVHDNDTLYYTRGNGTANFYQYEIGTDVWSQLSNLPGTLRDGASLVSDGVNTLYATRGDGTNEFYSYDIGLDTWTDLTSTDPVPQNIGSTSSQTQKVKAEYLNDSVWITTGYGDADAGDAIGDFFYRFDTTTGDWEYIPGVAEISDTGVNFNEGSDLTSVNGTDLYATAGTENLADNFWHYDILTDTWTALTGFADIGGGQQTADDGTSIAAFEDIAVYALRGINTDQFYRYDITGDSWTQPAVQQFPVNVGSAASQDIADMVFSVLGDGFFAMPGSGSIIYKIDATERVAPTLINSGSSPTQFVPFDVEVSAVDLDGNPVNVPADRDITLSLETGTGILGGTLTGTILSGQDSVTISGVTYDTDESGVVLRATDTSGVPTHLSALSDPFTVNPPPPTISSLDVTAGSTAGGTEVTITGTFFVETPNVTFDGYDADQVTFNSPTELVAVTSAHTAATVDVQVINPTGQTSNILTNAYTFAEPSLVSVNPAVGPTTGGTAVTLNGSLFGPSYYRREISFDNTPNPSPLTDYEASFTFDTATEIAAGKMRSDCGDIRIKANNQISNLPYWVEEGSCNTSSTRIWTKIPTIPASGFLSIYMTYGNPNLTSIASCEDVFVFCDDFSDGTLDTSIWEEDTGQFTEANGVLTSTGTNNHRLSSVTTFTGNYVLEGKNIVNTPPGNGYTPLGFFESTSNGAGYLNHPGTDYYREDSSFISIGDTIPEGTDLRYRFTMDGTSADYLIENYSTGATIHSVTDNDNGALNEKVAIGERYDNGNYNQTYNSEWDWIFVRNLESYDPIPAVGAETGAANYAEFDGIPATNVIFVDPTAVTAVTPAHAPGFVDVEIGNFDGTLGGSSTNADIDPSLFEYRTPPDVTSITPNTGINNQTYNVTFDGTDFASGITGRLEKSGESDIVCTSVNFVNTTQFTCDLDLASVQIGTWDVVVENPDTLTDTITDGFTVTLAPPDIVSVNPSNGPASGGTNVTISGTNFVDGGYKRNITINNGGSALTNHQVNFQLDTKAAIDAGNMNADCSDIRVKDSDLSDLDYWIDGPCDSEYTVIWAVVPSVPSGTKDISVTYGDPNLTTASDLNNVFPSLASANNVAWYKTTSIVPGEDEAATFNQTAGGITTNGNNVEKTGSAGWNAGFSTDQAVVGEGSIKFRAPTSGTQRSMVGLDNDQAITGNYTAIDFALYANNGTINIYENGTYRGAFFSYTSTDILSVDLEGNEVVYRKNGEDFYTSPTTPASTLYGEASLYDTGTTVQDIEVCTGECNYASVSTWYDQSGNGNDASEIADFSPGLIPASQNGLPALLFNGDDNFFRISNLDLFRAVPGVSIFATGNARSTSPTMHMFYASTPSAAAIRSSLFRDATNGFGLGGRRLDADGYQEVTGGTVSTGVFSFEEAIFDYANSDAFLYSNGSLLNSSTTFQTDGSTENTASAEIQVARAQGHQSFDGYMPEVILFDEAVGTSDRQEIERYLDSKYAVSGNEPTTSIGTQEENFTSVTFDGLDCTNTIFVNDTTITCDTPPHAAGLVDVVVTNPDGQQDTLSNGFTYDPPPTLNNTNPATGANNATLVGVQFNGADFVSGVTATLTREDETDIDCTNETFLTTALFTCDLPLTGAETGPWTITVTNPDGQTDTLTDGFTVTRPAPDVVSVTPIGGPTAGGTTVSVEGTDFFSRYTTPFEISNTGSTLTYYQVELTLDTATPIAAGNMKADCSDIRVIDTDQNSNLDHYLVGPCDDASTILWAEIPSIPNGTPAKTIYVTYGDSALTSESNIDDAFIREIDSSSIIAHFPSNEGSDNTCTGGEDVCDYSGNDNDGTFFGNPTWIAGYEGTAVQYDGSGDYMRADDVPPDLGSGEVTFGAWINPDNSTASFAFGFHDSAGNNENQVWWSNGEVDKFSYYDETLGVQQYSTSTATTGQWNHVVITIDSSDNAVLYLNGNQEATFTTTQRPSTNGRFTVGQDWDGGAASDFFTGAFDEVFVSDRALTEAEVVDLYNGLGESLTSAPNSLAVRNYNPTEPTSSDTAEEFLLDITFDGTSCTNISLVDSTEVTCDTPAHALGAVDVTLTNPDTQSDTLTNGFTYNLPPTLTNTVPDTGENTATLVGVQFNGTDFVSGITGRLTRIGESDINCTNTSFVNSTQFTCDLPITGATVGAWNVVVENPDAQTSTLTDAFTITYPAPTLTNVVPDNGPVVGGTNVAINGTNFVDGGGFFRAVTINNNSSAQTDYQVSFEVDTSTLIGAGKMNADCSDIRVKDTDQSTDIDFWVEPTTCNTATTTIWAEVPTIAASPASTTIYLSYGNSSLSDASSAPNTFIREIGGLQGYWPTDEAADDTCGGGEDMCDQSGNDFHMTEAGGATIVNDGKFGNARSFDGVSQYAIQDAVSDTVAGGPVTWGGWVRADDGGSSDFLHSFHDGSGNNLIMTTWGNVASRFGIYSGSYTNGPNSYSTGDWHFVLVAADNSSTNNLYINGIFEVLRSSSTKPVSGGRFSIAQEWDGVTPSNFFAGDMDETMIFSAELGATEISDLANNKGYATPNYPNTMLVRKWAEDTNPEDEAISVSSVGAETGGILNVTFDGTSCTNLTFVNSTQVTCDTPAHAAGQVDVVLTNPDGLFATLVNGFTYNPPPDLTSTNPTTGANTSTLVGVQFNGTDFLSGIDGRLMRTGEADISCTNTSFVNSTQFTCDLPLTGALIGDWNVVVENPDGQTDTLIDYFTVTNAPPDIVSVTPNTGPTTGGTSVTIGGSNFIDGGFNHTVTITNPTAGTLTNYAVPIFLDTAALITATEMNNDCGDIRMYDTDGTTPLSYWIEDCNSDDTIIWALVPSIPAVGKDIVLNYGISSNISQSSLATVFPVLNSNVEFWLKANEGTNATANSDPVSSWTDQSGNGNTVTTNALDPTWITNTVNGLPAVSFNGTNQSMGRSGFTGLPTGADVRTFFNVADYQSLGFGGVAYGTTASNGVYGNVIGANGQFYVQGWGTDYASGLNANGAGWNIHTSVFAGNGSNTLEQFVNGNLESTHSPTSINTGTNEIEIGREMDNTPYTNMDLAETIIFSDNLSTTDREAVEEYLDAKYDITGNAASTSVGSQTANPPSITFDGLDCSNIVYVNSTTLTCETPAHALGAVDVVVTNPDTQSDTLTNGFSYIGPPDETTSTFTAATASTIADGVTRNILTATVNDAASSPLEGQAVTVAQSAGSGTTTIEAVNCSQSDVGIITKGTTNSSGEACFAIHSEDITTPGSNTYEATITSIPAAITQTADVEFIADYPDLDDSTFTSAPGSVAADGATPSTLTATIVDSLGRFITGQSVTVTDDGSGITYAPVSANENTNGSGVADFDVTSTTAQTATFTANLDSTIYYNKSTYSESASPTFINNYEGTASTLIVGSQGDDVEATTTLPFDFELFGTNVPASTNIYVCSNGFISLASSGCPSSGSLSNAIAGFFRDLDTTSGGIYQEIASDNNSVRFLWDAQDAGTSNPIFFEIILYQNNTAEFHYFANDGQTARIGLYDATPSIAPDVASTYDNSVFGDTSATQLYNPATGPATPAVVEEPQVTFTAGTVDPGNSTIVAVPTEVLADGVETSTITVTLRDAFNNPVPGRTVELSDDQAVSQIDYVGYPTPPPYPTDVTDANGEAVFQVRSTAVDTTTFTANDVTGATVFIGTADVEFTCIIGQNQQCVQVEIEENPGVLTITAPDDFAFPGITSATSSQEIFSIDSATPYTLNVNDLIVVTDTQNAGGFNLQLQASAFEDSGTSEQIPLSGFYAVTQASSTGGTQINGVEYDNGYAGVTGIDATQDNATAGNLDSAGTFTTHGDNLDAVIDIMLAPVTIAEVGRNGQFKQNIQYYLQIPAFQLSGSYEVTLTFDLTRTPAT